MNLCILSYGRTGGTTFCKWISKELDRIYIHEPFNKNHNWMYKNTNFLTDNCVIKLEPEDLDKILGDKITIGLIRKNVYNCAISNLKAIQTNKWHSPYKVDEDWLKKNEFEIEELSKKILKQNDKILNMKYDITLTYEGLFENKSDIPIICKFLNIKNLKYIQHMNESNKYRKNLEYKSHLI